MIQLPLMLEYDPDARAAYLRLRSGIAAETVEIAPDVLMDIGDDGLPIGFELLNPSAILGKLPGLPDDHRLDDEQGRRAG